MIHPLATTAPCKFAVASLVAKEKINKYMERNLLWICKHWFVSSSVFLFNCSAYTCTHTLWVSKFTAGQRMRWLAIAQVFAIVWWEDTGSVEQNQRWRCAACLSSRVLFRHFIHLLSHPCEFSTFQAWFWFFPFFWVVLFLSEISLPSAWQKWSPLDLHLSPAASVRPQTSHPPQPPF